MIYLISNSVPKNLDKNVKMLEVCKIKYLNFSVNLDEFNALILTSKHAIKALEINNIKKSLNLKVYAIGQGSFQAAKDFGFKDIYLAKNAHGKEFGYEIKPLLKDKKVIYIRALKTLSNLKNILKDIDLKEIVGYENICQKCETKPPKNSVLIFTSPKNVECFIENFGWDKSYRAISIGKTTKDYLLRYAQSLQSPVQSIDECIKLALSII